MSLERLMATSQRLSVGGGEARLERLEVADIQREVSAKDAVAGRHHTLPER